MLKQNTNLLGLNSSTILTPPSPRAKIVTRRTYNRPTNAEGTTFESWEDTVDRVIRHQKWLWNRAAANDTSEGLVLEMNDELRELRQLMLERKVSTSGRTLWLGGTDVAKQREASQFNCAFTYVETVYDIVDCLWLLLQGCGVGFRAITGSLNGFRKPLKNLQVIRSERTEKGGVDHNVETLIDGVWTIKVGDSAEAWAKSIGKIMAGKFDAHTLILDFSEIRPAGERLTGYGWISSGDEQLATAFVRIVKLMNMRAGELLRRIDILDLMNHLGTVLSSRRSAEIFLFSVDDPEWRELAAAKKDYWEHDNEHRTQSNNSILFENTPTRAQLEEIFAIMVDSGGSEPAFVNAAAASRRAPWFKGVNPCVEILLANKGFCNLVEVDIAKFKEDSAGLLRALHIAARANYRQTCVNLRDGVLQEAWHLNNQFLRLCGVGLTGTARRPDIDAPALQAMQRAAVVGAYSMADDLGLSRPKNVTCVKPSGTLSKIMDTTEGVHKPLGKYIFNNVNFSKHDPLVEILRDARYHVFDHPHDTSSVLVRLPVKFEGVKFDVVDGTEVNLESAIDQLERYKLYQTAWSQQNTSVTVSYDVHEVPAIITWLLANWDIYVGVSFLFRTDPTKTAKDLGYVYLPQEVVTKEVYEAYVETLKDFDIDQGNSLEELDDDGCAQGICPVR